MKIKTIIMLSVLFTVTTINLHALMYANGSDCSFDPNLCNNNSSIGTSIPFDSPKSGFTLRNFIINGAMLFFDSTSYYWIYVKNYEIGDKIAMEPYLLLATDYMRFANSIYNKLYLESLFFQYDVEIIVKLKDITSLM